MSFLLGFVIGFFVGLIPMVYGIIRAMRMTGGKLSNFSWDATKQKANEQNKTEVEKVEL